MQSDPSPISESKNTMEKVEQFATKHPFVTGLGMGTTAALILGTLPLVPYLAGYIAAVVNATPAMIHSYRQERAIRRLCGDTINPHAIDEPRLRAAQHRIEIASTLHAQGQEEVARKYLGTSLADCVHVIIDATPGMVPQGKATEFDKLLAGAIFTNTIHPGLGHSLALARHAQLPTKENTDTLIESRFNLPTSTGQGVSRRGSLGIGDLPL